MESYQEDEMEVRNYLKRKAESLKEICSISKID